MQTIYKNKNNNLSNSSHKRKKKNSKKKKNIYFRKTQGIKPCIPEGPFKSQLEKNIHLKLSTKLPKSIIHINKAGLLNNKKKMELDLYFPLYKIGLEIQGPLHSSKVENILNDFIKKRMFKQLNIDIIYIYSNSSENFNHSLNKCIQILKKN